MLYTYSVTPLSEGHFEERCADIADLVHRRIAVMPLFSMKLTPEGDPVWDKAGKMIPLYRRYRDALAERGVPSGILVQASLGHGYPITPNPFRPYVNLTDGAPQCVCCPEDDAFLDHFADVLRRLAAERPAAMMLDDDFRLMMRPGKGCACARHMEMFCQRAGVQMTREELYAHLSTHPANDPLARIFAEIQRDSLIRAATVFRAAIDEVEPTIQGINCTSGHICESVVYTNKIFAGQGNPTMVRVPNGIYAPLAVRGFSDTMRQAAICSAKLRKHGIEIILAETDTIPFNRYAKSARYLHAHFTASVLEGLRGAKHWLTRTSAFEPASGKAYRDILARHAGMYDRLAALSEGIAWQGCGSLFAVQEDMAFHTASANRSHDNCFVTLNLERMGIPFYFTEENRGAAFLEDDIADELSDAQVCDLFARGSVFLDGASAQRLARRGFGDLLGVDAVEWSLGRISGETFDGTPEITCTAQRGAKELRITDPRTETLSHVYRKEDGAARLLSPAVTVLRRGEGKITVVFCGSPRANFNYMEGFAFLNESRKAQLISLLREAGALPVCAVGDDEFCLRAGRTKDGTLLCAIYPLGVDPAEEIRLRLAESPRVIRMILPDGRDTPVNFTPCGGEEYTLPIRAEAMYPIVLLIR